MDLIHRVNQFVELKDPQSETAVWRYVYGGKPKPFFHPLATPAGHILSLFEPSDHVWHRGLWFTIKFVNGENFWEERPPFGTQNLLAPPRVDVTADGGVWIEHESVWVRPESTQTAIRESRSWAYRPLEPGAYTLDLLTTLQPTADVLLDRTPFTTWGGYGGLTFRANRNWIKTRLAFDDGSTSDRPTPVHSPWCELSGPIDGAASSNAAIAIFDHPSNPRHPTPWYGGTGIGHYFNAAFLFHEPMRLAAGEKLTFRYRVLVHDDLWPIEKTRAAYQNWAR